MKKNTTPAEQVAAEHPVSEEQVVVYEAAGNDLTTTSTQAVVAQPPAHEVAMGFENADMTELTLPIVAVLQPISTQLTDDNYADLNLKAGQIINTLTMEQVPPVFTPLAISDTRVLFAPKKDSEKAILMGILKNKFGYTPTEDGAKFICRSGDNRTGSQFGSCADCGLAEFHGNSKPWCNKCINVMGRFGDDPLPSIVRFSNTSHKHGQQFKQLAFISCQGSKPLFSKRYRLTSIKKSDAQKGTTWFELQVAPAGNTPAEEMESAQAMYLMFKGYLDAVTEVAQEVAQNTEY